MSVTIDSNGVQLVGDGFGINWARKQLAAAPATAVKMQFVFRYWMDTFGTSTGDRRVTGEGWDHTNFFGLGFDNTIPSYDNPFIGNPNAAGNPYIPSDFLGWCNQGPGYDTTSGDHHHDWALSFGSGLGASRYVRYAGYSDTPVSNVVDKYVGIYNGNDGFLSASLDDIANPSTTGIQLNAGVPQNPATGAEFTGMWEVYGSTTDKSVYGRMAINFDSYAEGDDMFDTITDAALSSDTTALTIHGDTMSNWRNADNTMNFPRWLKFSYTEATQKLVLKYFKVRYLDVNENVIT